jgi:hypothetical protein
VGIVHLHSLATPLASLREAPPARRPGRPRQSEAHSQSARPRQSVVVKVALFGIRRRFACISDIFRYITILLVHLSLEPLCSCGPE